MAAPSRLYPRRCPVTAHRCHPLPCTSAAPRRLRGNISSVELSPSASRTGSKHSYQIVQSSTALGLPATAHHKSASQLCAAADAYDPDPHLSVSTRIKQAMATFSITHVEQKPTSGQAPVCAGPQPAAAGTPAGPAARARPPGGASRAPSPAASSRSAQFIARREHFLT